MTSFLIGLGIPLVAWSVHLVIWRLLPRSASLKNLIKIFFVSDLALIIIVRLANISHTPGEYLRIVILMMGISFSYIISYSAIEIDSPTLILYKNLMASPAGLSKAEVEKLLASQSSIDRRIDLLVGEGGFVLENGQLQVSGKLPLLYRLVVFYRKLLGRKVKGG